MLGVRDNEYRSIRISSKYLANLSSLKPPEVSALGKGRLIGHLHHCKPFNQICALTISQLRLGFIKLITRNRVMKADPLPGTIRRHRERAAQQRPSSRERGNTLISTSSGKLIGLTAII